MRCRETSETRVPCILLEEAIYLPALNKLNHTLVLLVDSLAVTRQVFYME